MTILLDQCVPRQYLGLLTAWGYTASLLSTHIRPDATDAEVLAIAQSLDAVLLTVDMDFSNIITYPPQNYGGIIVVRDEGVDDEALCRTLKQALKDLYRDGLRTVLVIVSPSRYRVRHSE